ncbi:MAG: TROVE domain-containing protein [Microscillaceae bacterium]|nr:TROVE domain-containing protein [Microscillaceae bacterium]MDW8461671.1 TROVE domain-containing protein [Cytophagales bacterium]
MRFNTQAQNKDLTINHEGAEAYYLPVKMDLYTTVVTSALSDQFYEKADKRIERLRELIKQCEPTFVAKLAIYAREQMYLRSVPLVLAVELAKIHKNDNLVSRLVARIVQRADEITELLAYYQLANERNGTKKLGKLSKQIQKGLAQAFNKFDEYQFAKYNRKTEIKLRDALFLVHPKAKNETQQAIFDKIVKDELQTPYTWEVELSVLGQQTFATEQDKQQAFQAKWEELIDSGKVGYMALLRNLRNILQAKVSATHLQKVATRIANQHEVANSKQLPFRFLAAYKELINLEEPSPFVSLLLESLEQAVKASVVNLQGFDAQTTVLLACDVSGSMQRPISPRSKIENYDIGLILAMLLQSECQSVISGFFGDTWKVVNLPSSHILSNCKELRRREGEVGYSTNGYKVLEYLIENKLAVDKVMFFTDCQMWNNKNTDTTFAGTWQKYKKIAPRAKLYLFDLVGYGNTPLQIERQDVYLIAGWSDKIFEVLENLEKGEDTLAMIENIRF